MERKAPPWNDWIALVGVLLVAIAAVRSFLWSRREVVAISGSGDPLRQLLEADVPGTGKKPISPGVKVKRETLPSIDDRVGRIRELMRKYAEHPVIIEQTTKILSRKCGDRWCIPEKNWDAEAVALFAWVRRHVRYRREPGSRDTFSAPDRTLMTGGGDCDDYVLTLGSMLMASGAVVKLRVVAADGSKDYNHIYLLVDPAADGKKWVPMDASVDAKPGWEVEGAVESARTGRPSQRVNRVRDYSV